MPLDQALDIILQARGLDMRKNGNVIWIAPRTNSPPARSSISKPRPRSAISSRCARSFQINYHKAKSVAEFLKSKDQTVLSKRGSVVPDERSNKIFVSDIPSRLEERRLIAEIDVEVRQVLIEAQIVEATDTFAQSGRPPRASAARPAACWAPPPAACRVYRNTFGSGNLSNTGYQAGRSSRCRTSTIPSASICRPRRSTTSRPVRSRWPLERAATRHIDLEVSALEADGRGKVVSRPRVMTADKAEAIIEQGTEIPYNSATSPAPPACLPPGRPIWRLKVKPQVTPDGKIMMTLDVNKDSPNYNVA